MTAWTSAAGLGALERREGMRLAMYRDSAGLPTIGVGHLLTQSELRSGKLTALGIPWHAGITRAQVDLLLRADLAVAEAAVRTVRVALAAWQFDALVSFVFNVGAEAFAGSTLLKLLNSGDYGAVPEQLRRWIHSAGKVDPVLEHRRDQEVEQWEGH